MFKMKELYLSDRYEKIINDYCHNSLPAYEEVAIKNNVSKQRVHQIITCAI